MPEPSDVAAERAYRNTRTRILTGEFAGGQLLSEVAVSVELGLSRTPVHEAFLRLEAEQLLELIPRRGAIVRPMSPSEASDILTMRRGIELASAEQVFTRGGPDPWVSESLSDNLARQADLVDDGNVEGFVAADDEFHALLIDASRNPIAQHFYGQLRVRQQRLRNLLLRIDPANLASSYGDHQKLAAHFLAADRDGFSAVLTAHLDRYQGAL